MRPIVSRSALLCTVFNVCTVFAVFTACAPAVQINGAVALRGPDCVADAAGPAQQIGLLDLGFDLTTAHSYTAALVVETDAEDVTFEAVEVYYSTDADRGDDKQLVNAGTPVGPTTARRTSVSATSANDVVFAQLVTEEDALALASEAFVNDGLVNSDSRVRVVAHARLLGQTAAGVDVTSQELPFPIELCRGCILPQCEANEVVIAEDACFIGQDVPARCGSI